jgi:hypothetical protein
MGLKATSISPSSGEHSWKSENEKESHQDKEESACCHVISWHIDQEILFPLTKKKYFAPWMSRITTWEDLTVDS